jgi:signal peptidase I
MSTWKTVMQYWKRTRYFLSEDKSVWSWLANLAIAFVLIKFIVYPLLGFIFGTALPVVAVVSSSMDHSALNDGICGVYPAPDIKSYDDYWNACGGWYEARGITKEAFREYPFHNGFDKGDIMVIVGGARSEIKQGDVMVFEARQQYPIIHRVVSIAESPQGAIYSTKGDHNPVQIQEYVVVNELGQASYCERQGQAAPCTFGASRVTNETQGAVAIIDEASIAEEKVLGKAVARIPWLGYVKIWFTDALFWVINLF